MMHRVASGYGVLYSGAAGYDPDFKDGDSFDVMTKPGTMDGLSFNGDVAIGPYSVVILLQD
jgi:hypothetical protein